MKYYYQNLYANLNTIKNFCSKYIENLEIKRSFILEFLDDSSNTGLAVEVLKSNYQDIIEKYSIIINTLEAISQKCDFVLRLYEDYFETQNFDYELTKNKIKMLEEFIIEYKQLDNRIKMQNLPSNVEFENKNIVVELNVLKNKYEQKIEKFESFENEIMHLFNEEFQNLNNLFASQGQTNGINANEDVFTTVSLIPKMSWRNFFKHELTEEDLNITLEESEKLLGISYEDYKNMMINQFGIFEDEEIKLIWDLRVRCVQVSGSVELGSYLYRVILARLVYTYGNEFGGPTELYSNFWDFTVLNIDLNDTLINKLKFDSRQSKKLYFCVNAQHILCDADEIPTSVLTSNKNIHPAFIRFLRYYKNYDEQKINEMVENIKVSNSETLYPEIQEWKDSTSLRYKQQYNKNDFSHQMATSAAINNRDSIISDMAGWLGDLVTNCPKYSKADRNADMDALAITQRDYYSKANYFQCEINYYDKLEGNGPYRNFNFWPSAILNILGLRS